MNRKALAIHRSLLTAYIGLEMKHKLLLALTLSVFGNASFAQSLPPVLIQSLGCDQATDSCSLTIANEQFGSSECTSNKIGWDSSSDQGKLALALLSSAMMTEHQVKLTVTEGCYNS